MKNISTLINGYFQRYEYVKDINKQLIIDGFEKLQEIKLINECVIHIRCGDQWLYNKDPNNQIVHPGQPVLPIKFYREQLKNNTLPVRFVCENLDDPYIKELQKNFPDAIFQSLVY